MKAIRFAASVLVVLCAQCCNDDPNLFGTITDDDGRAGTPATAGNSGAMAGSAAAGRAVADSGGSFAHAGAPSAGGSAGSAGDDASSAGSGTPPSGGSIGHGGAGGVGASPPAPEPTAGDSSGPGGAGGAESVPSGCIVAGDCRSKILNAEEKLGLARACSSPVGTCEHIVQGICCPARVAALDSPETECALAAIDDARAAGCVCVSGAPCTAPADPGECVLGGAPIGRCF